MFLSLKPFRAFRPPQNRRADLSWGFWLVCGTCLGGLPGSVRIELKQEAEVVSSPVTLEAIASIRGENQADGERLRALSLGPAPASGAVVRLDRPTLQRWISARLGLHGHDLEWSGSQVCTIRIASQYLSGNRITECAQLELNKSLEKAGVHSEATPVRPAPMLQVPRGEVTLRVRPIVLSSIAQPSNSRPSEEATWVVPRQQTIWVEIWVDGRFVRLASVGFDVKTFVKALVARRSLRAGEPLGADNVSVQDVEAADSAPLPVQALLPARVEEPSVTDRPSLCVRRAVAAGEIVTRSNVEPVALVKQGNSAILVAVQGAIALESKVEVLEDGSLGQVVRVKLPNASGSIRAHVVGPGRVEVQP